MPLLLLVDDDPDSLSALTELVTAEGFDTAVACDLASARTVLANRRPDAVLVDYNLPDGAGLELAEACAESGIDFVLVTGEGTLDTAIQALRAGASDILTKPVDVAELLRIVDTAADGIAGRPRSVALGVDVFDSASDRFVLHRMRATSGAIDVPGTGARIAFCLRGGADLASGAQSLALGPAESAFIRGDESGVVLNTGEIYVVSAPDPS